MTEILTLFITILSSLQVSDGERTVNMVNFGGHAESQWFSGDIMPGGVDTQTYTGNVSSLSARYMIQGVDCAGDSCRIYVSNEASWSEDFTRPSIVTDSDTLSFLNRANLRGKIDAQPDRLVIRIYADPDVLP